MVIFLFQQVNLLQTVVDMGKKTLSEDKGLIDELKEEAKELVTKIQGHFIAIEEHRRKDRELWRSFNRRLESLEEVKSQRGKRRRRGAGEQDKKHDVDYKPSYEVGA